MSKCLLSLAILCVASAQSTAQEIYDRRFRLGVSGSVQYGIPPFHTSSQKSIAGAVNFGFGGKLYGYFAIPGAARILAGVQIGSFTFHGPDGSREALLYRHYSHPRFYTTVRNTSQEIALQQVGLVAGYVLKTGPYELTAFAGFNVGSVNSAFDFSIYRKERGDNYSEQIMVTASGEENRTSFFYPSLAMNGAVKLTGRLFLTAAASVHGGRFRIIYTERTETLFGDIVPGSFAESQTILHGGIDLGLELRIGAMPKPMGSIR